MTRLVYFVRHGQTAWNAEYRLQGQAETMITPHGRQQAEGNGGRLAQLIPDPAGFDYVASPMKRTRETMERVRTVLGLPPDGYRTEPRIVELSFGDWQGFTLSELEQRDPGSTKARLADKWRFVPPGKGAESYAMLQERVTPWFESLARDTVCVTHGGVLRVILRLVEALSEDEAASLDIPQDRVLRLQAGRLEWL